MRNFVRQTLLVDRTDLLQQHDGVAVEAMRRRIHLYMRRQLCFLNLSGDGSYDDGRAEAVTDVILYYENGTDSSLFRSYDWGQIGKKNISAFDDQALHPAH